MKKMTVSLLVLLALCMALPASAQVNLGVLGGLNLANLDVDPEPETWKKKSNRTAFGFGGVLDYSLNESIALRLEPMYLQKGAIIEDTGEGNMIYEIEWKGAYLEIPMLVKYSFGASDIKPYIIAGPTIGFNLSAKAKFTMGDFSEEDDVKDDTKSTDFGLGFGAGMSLPMGNNSIFIEARYALGLTNIEDGSQSDPEDNTESETKTKGIQIFAGITFPLGSK